MATNPPADCNHDLVEIRDRIPRPILNPICSPSSTVSFHHPAYDSTRLIELSSLDGPNGGIHYGTALLVCGIIAGNIWDGWLTEERRGNKVDLDKEALLRRGDYFFHVPWPTDVSEEERSYGAYKYPIVPSFQHWPFPHDSPPPGWTFNPDLTANVAPLSPIPSISSVSQAVRDRDGSCGLSGYKDGIERAHLCPRSEAQWFIQQEMDRYNISRSLVGVGLVDDTANALALRSDIHLSFDAGTFVFTRKLDQWVSHFFTPTFNLGPEYHNTTVEIPYSVHPAFLLTRLAWAIFPRVRNFLIRGEKRLVTLRQGTGRARDVEELDRVHLCRVLKIPPRGRSNSPTKRQREEDTTGGATNTSATASKRARLDLAESPQPAESLATAHSRPASTPELCNADAASTPSPSQLSEPPTLHADGETNERRCISALRQSALKAQRPINRGLLCCDYDAAEVANAAGVEGPRIFGGAHLCMECLGAEYRDGEGCDPTPLPTMRDDRSEFPAPD